jgi:hypothetical protein
MIYDFSNYQLNQSLINNKVYLVEQFICKYYETWIDSDNNLYVRQEYCEHGDLLDYLTKLENYNINLLDVEFYWDLIFEILCVSQHIK